MSFSRIYLAVLAAHISILIIGLVLFIGLTAWVFSSASESTDEFVPLEEAEAEIDFADEVANQYDLIDPADETQRCLQAESVAQAYLDAFNQEKYDEWNAIADVDCAAAGLR